MTSRTIIITGAGGGIGRAMAIASAERHWNVAVLDIDHDHARKTAEQAIEAGAPAAVPVDCDVSDEDSVQQAFDRVEREIGSVRGVVANAGIELNAPLADMPKTLWDQVLAVNLTGVFLTARAAIRQFLANRTHGSIVCTSSPSAFIGFAGGDNAAYGASKGGISAFVRSVAIDYAQSGIRVNGLVPGATDTPILLLDLEGDQRKARAEEIASHAATQIPLGRLARPAEIAAAAVWLLGDESSYVTGSNLVCDGGLLAKSANDF